MDAPVPAEGPLADRLDAALPQTQCTRCGYADCRAYAEAMATGAAINRCPPGGAQGVVRLAAIAGRRVERLDPECGTEAPRALAVIEEADCIGCTLCIQACPVDCIVGAPKLMHTVIDAWCSGCERCVPACPVDCIAMQPITGALTGWQAWSPTQAEGARARYRSRAGRLEREARDRDERLAARARTKLADLAAHSRLTDPAALDAKRAVIEAALERVSRRRSSGERQLADDRLAP